jgi:hypothetical protein
LSAQPQEENHGVEIKGENGAGDQVFEADSDQQMIAKLVTAHENATKKFENCLSP